MRTETPPAVKLADYQPYPFRIEGVRMLFRLHPTDTRVVTELSVKRMGATGSQLRLDGEKLTLKAIKLNGQPLSAQDYVAGRGQPHPCRPGRIVQAGDRDQHLARNEHRTLRPLHVL